MTHHATATFWRLYGNLPEDVRVRADRSYKLLKPNPRHPSLRFKKVGRVWSTRVDDGYRALALERQDGFN